MGDVITYVIIVLFAIFFIYFMYTLIDTFFLSKRAKRSAISVSHLKPEKQTQVISKSDDSQKSSLQKEEDVTQEMVSRNDVETGIDSSKEKNNAQTNVVKSEGNSTSTLKEDVKPKKEKKKFFSGFKSLFSKSKKSKQLLEESTPTFIPNKIDDAYSALVDDFVKKTKGSWNQKEFYEFILTLVAKGYDKKPSEVNRDILLAKDKLRSEEIEQERVAPKPEPISEDTSSESVEVIQEEEMEREKVEKEEEKKQEKEAERVHETILKEAVKKKENHKSTRQELDKTLSEIKQLRERLKGI